MSSKLTPSSESRRGEVNSVGVYDPDSPQDRVALVIGSRHSHRYRTRVAVAIWRSLVSRHTPPAGDLGEYSTDRSLTSLDTLRGLTMTRHLTVGMVDAPGEAMSEERAREPLFERIAEWFMPIGAIVLVFCQIGWCLALWPTLLGLVKSDLLVYATVGSVGPDDDFGGAIATWVAYLGTVGLPALVLLVTVFLAVVAKVIGGDIGDAFDSVVSHLIGALFVLSPVGLTVGWFVAVPVGRVAVALGMAETAAWLWIVFPGTGLVHFLISRRYSAWLRGSEP